GTVFANISGATSTTYTHTASLAENGNLYRAFFSNVCGTATSTAATLIVNPLPTAGLTGVTVCAGDPATNLTATASGNGPFTYLVKGSSSFSFTTNTSSTSITVPTGAGSGTYSNLVTSGNGCNSALATAVVTVNPKPTAGL